jgi:hypothetical protein
MLRMLRNGEDVVLAGWRGGWVKWECAKYTVQLYYNVRCSLLPPFKQVVTPLIA